MLDKIEQQNVLKHVFQHPSMKNICLIPPEGWFCTRKPGHDGPCAAIPLTYTFDIVQSNSGMWHIYDMKGNWLRVTWSKLGAKFWCWRHVKSQLARNRTTWRSKRFSYKVNPIY